jgi:hypothetical protein
MPAVKLEKKEATADHCNVHNYHRPTPLRLVDHHIQPLGMGGKDVWSNRVTVCDTGHYNIHRLLGDLIKSDGESMRPGGSHMERQLARQGWTMWHNAGRPGKPVFEDHEY